MTETIKQRKGRTKNAIFEIKSIIEDTRMLVIGGALGAIDIFELAVIPMLLHNCDTWCEINEKDTTELEELQILFYNILFQVPSSCPKPAGTWETGSLLMENRIACKKLNLGKYIQQQKETELSHQVFNEQLKHNYPGLAKECLELAKDFDIGEEYGDINTNTKRFRVVNKNKTLLKNETQMRNKIKRLKKSLLGPLRSDSDNQVSVTLNGKRDNC